MWKSISPLLRKFSSLKPRKEMLVDDVVGAVYSRTGIQLNKNDIKINNLVAYIKADPIIKNELFLKKEDILEELHQKFLSQIQDIR